MSANQLPTVFFTKDSFRSWRSTVQHPIGFAPTMGNLHLGHLHLVEAALKMHATVVISIFVNPTQFGPKDDFEKYPRTLDQDCQLLADLSLKYPESKLIVFAPKDSSEIYHSNFETNVNPGKMGDVLEGKSRPGHFHGVSTVVTMLLHIVQPTHIYLGKKDYQQLRIIEKIVRDLHFNVSVVACETIRNQQGLALSSRNNFLSNEQLQTASKFPLALNQLKKELMAYWEEHQQWHQEKVAKHIDFFRSQSELDWDYLALCQQDLTAFSENSKHLVLLGVVKVHSIRLLDNLEFSV